MPGAVVPPDWVADELVVVVPLVVAVEVLAGALALVWVWVVDEPLLPQPATSRPRMAAKVTTGMRRPVGDAIVRLRLMSVPPKSVIVCSRRAAESRFCALRIGWRAAS